MLRDRPSKCRGPPTRTLATCSSSPKLLHNPDNVLRYPAPMLRRDELNLTLRPDLVATRRALRVARPASHANSSGRSTLTQIAHRGCLGRLISATLFLAFLPFGRFEKTVPLLEP